MESQRTTRPNCRPAATYPGIHPVNFSPAGAEPVQWLSHRNYQIGPTRPKRAQSFRQRFQTFGLGTFVRQKTEFSDAQVSNRYLYLPPTGHG